MVILLAEWVEFAGFRVGIRQMSYRGGRDIEIIMSHNLLWRHIVLQTVGVYSAISQKQSVTYHWNQYDKEI